MVREAYNGGVGAIGINLRLFSFAHSRNTNFVFSFAIPQEKKTV